MSTPILENTTFAPTASNQPTTFESIFVYIVAAVVAICILPCLWKLLKWCNRVSTQEPEFIPHINPSDNRIIYVNNPNY